MEAHLLQRICAYMVDVILVSLLISLTTSWIPASKKYEEAVEKEKALVERVNSGDIQLKDVYDEYFEINYTLDKERIIVSLLTTVVTLGYFATFAYYNDGKTLGKKLLHIKVASEDGEELTHQQMFLRTLIVHGSLSSIISMLLLSFISSSQYISVFVVQLLQSLLLVVTMLMIIFRKDKKGLHDLLFRTKVIKEK